MIDDPIAAAIARVRAQFFAQGDTRVGPLRDAQRALDGGESVPWDSAHEAAHKIAGLAGTIGLPELSDAARDAEAAIIAARDDLGAHRAALRAALHMLLGAWDAAATRDQAA